MAKAAVKEETLAEIAEREADEAEKEVVTLNTEEGPEEDGEPGEEVYVPPEYTAQEKKAATAVLAQVRKTDILGPSAAVEALLQLVDVLPMFTPPKEWPGKEDEEYHEAKEVANMAEILVKGCKNLTINPDHLICLWRNKEKWEAGGKTVRGAAKSFPIRVRHLLQGKRACVEINYHHFKTLNPLQRIFSVYHEIRILDKNGGTQKPQFTGFYDEMEIFGSRVFREMMELARVIELGAEVTHPHQLSIFEE